MRKLALLLLVVSCAKSKDSAPAPADKPAEPAKPAAAPPAEKPAAAASSGDQELTLDQATEGLGKDGKLMADFTTELGTIHCTLLPEAAPKTVASFVGLARGLRPFQDPTSGQWVKKPFFDGLAFHRVIEGFMIQGGDPLSIDYANPRIGTGGPGYTLPDELAPDLKFDHPGVLAMANTGPRTHSGGSQFFITDAPTPPLNGGYVIFGQCNDPDVVKKIASVKKGRADKPEQAVTMKVKVYKQ